MQGPRTNLHGRVASCCVAISSFRAQRADAAPAHGDWRAHTQKSEYPFAISETQIDMSTDILGKEGRTISEDINLPAGILRLW